LVKSLKLCHFWWLSLVLSTVALPAQKRCVDALDASTPLHGLVNQTFDFKFSPGSPAFQLRFYYESNADNWLSLPGEIFSGVVLTSTSPEEPPHIIAIVNSLIPSGKNRYHLGWMLRTRHDAVLQKIDEQQRLRPGSTKFEVLQHLAAKWSPGTREDQQIQIQCEFILAELRRFHLSRLPMGLSDRVWRSLRPAPRLNLSDTEVDRYFSAAPSLNQYQGITLAMLEKVSSVLPLGAEIEFDIANVVTNRQLSQGGTWDRTLLGRYATKAGFQLDEIYAQPHIRKVVIVKKREPESVFFHR